MGSRFGVACAAVVLVVAVAACKPLPLGSGGAPRIGNDPALNCPQFQPTAIAPCGPQPMVWAAIQGPYETFANGDPYTTKCGRNLTASAAACSSGPYAGGATNELYDPTGYEYAIDVTAADVGRPLQLAVYDAGSYLRRKATTATTTAIVTASAPAGSTVLTRSSGSFAPTDIGASLTGTGIAPGTRVERYLSATQIEMSAAVTSGGSRSVTFTYATDCNSAQAPFTTAPYAGASWIVGNCQTGDSGSAPFQVQLFDNDGDDLKVSYDVPEVGCHLYVGPGEEPWVHKNQWRSVCTFTPTTAGIFPVRVKSSDIVLPDGTAIPDQGSGYNNFSLRVTGGTTTRLYAIDAISRFTNTPSPIVRAYLAEITTADAGKRLEVDLFDAGDSSSGEISLRVLAPPGGSPGIVPNEGTAIPAAGVADSCRYNPVASATRGPAVSAPDGAEAPGCTVLTKVAASPGGTYDNGWLRIEIDISPEYTCGADCWWTVEYTFSGTTTVPTERTVWAPTVVARPAPPATTTTTESTTTTTESTTTTTESTTTTEPG